MGERIFRWGDLQSTWEDRRAPPPPWAGRGNLSMPQGRMHTGAAYEKWLLDYAFVVQKNNIPTMSAWTLLGCWAGLWPVTSLCGVVSIGKSQTVHVIGKSRQPDCRIKPAARRCQWSDPRPLGFAGFCCSWLCFSSCFCLESSYSTKTVLLPRKSKWPCDWPG